MIALLQLGQNWVLWVLVLTHWVSKCAQPGALGFIVFQPSVSSDALSHALIICTLQAASCLTCCGIQEQNEGWGDLAVGNRDFLHPFCSISI